MQAIWTLEEALIDLRKQFQDLQLSIEKLEKRTF